MDSSSLPTSLTLLEQLRQPVHADAWSRFVRLYTPLFQTWAQRQGYRADDADDLTQEVLVKLMHAMPQYVRAEGQSFRGWLFRVTANVCRDYRRRRATRPLPPALGLSGADADPPVVEFEEAEYRKSLVDSGLATIRGEFEEKSWAAFEQLMIHNREASDVMTNLGMTKNAVYIAKSRVLTRLRQVIGEFLE